MIGDSMEATVSLQWLQSARFPGYCSIQRLSLCRSLLTEFVYSGAWWRIGRVDTFRPKGRGFESRSSRHRRDLGQVLHLQLPVALRRVNSDSVNSCVWERFRKAHAVRSAIEMNKYNTIQYHSDDSSQRAVWITVQSRVFAYVGLWLEPSSAGILAMIPQPSSRSVLETPVDYLIR